jgi:hypothetical protein
LILHLQLGGSSISTSRNSSFNSKFASTARKTSFNDPLNKYQFTSNNSAGSSPRNSITVEQSMDKGYKSPGSAAKRDQKPAETTPGSKSSEIKLDVNKNIEHREEKLDDVDENLFRSVKKLNISSTSKDQEINLVVTLDKKSTLTANPKLKCQTLPGHMSKEAAVSLVSKTLAERTSLMGNEGDKHIQVTSVKEKFKVSIFLTIL